MTAGAEVLGDGGVGADVATGTAVFQVAGEDKAFVDLAVAVVI